MSKKAKPIPLQAWAGS